MNLRIKREREKEKYIILLYMLWAGSIIRAGIMNNDKQWKGHNIYTDIIFVNKCIFYLKNSIYI